MLRKCSNFLPGFHALENISQGPSQGLRVFWRWQNDFSSCVPQLNQLAQVRHLWCCFVSNCTLTNCFWKESTVVLSHVHIVHLSRCTIKCPIFFMLLMYERESKDFRACFYFWRESDMVWYLSLPFLCLFRLVCSGNSTLLNVEPNWCLSYFFYYSSVCPICFTRDKSHYWG